MKKAYKNKLPEKRSELPKSPTGIGGLDEITYGGLPKGRPTLIAGSAGCGKTLIALEFLVNGITRYNEPGVFIAFEESGEDLEKNVQSLGINLPRLIRDKKLYVDHIKVERSEIEETGEYDLDGLFIRIDMAIRAVGAKRIVLDTIESLFSGLTNAAILRSEIRRLFGWLKEKGVTAIITGEKDSNNITRQGLEEYVSDCVILLDHQVNNKISSRRLRIVKYRGSVHGTNEYPFLIDESGISVLPLTSLKLNHTVSNKRISTGIPRLDEMMEGKGFYKGTTILVSGTAGTGKTALASTFTRSSAAENEKVLYFAFEESHHQIIRNMRSAGINLEPFVKKGLLHFHAMRPQFYGLEMHLVKMYKLISEVEPTVVIVDPITNLISSGAIDEVHSVLTRLVDFLKTKQITAMLTSLSNTSGVIEQTSVAISSLVDTWIWLRDLEMNGERNRGIYILKSRGMAHSNQIREFRITGKGIELIDVYRGEEGVLTGSSRKSQEDKEKAFFLEQKEETARKMRELKRKRKTLENQIAILRTNFKSEEEEILEMIKQDIQRDATITQNREEMGRMRGETNHAKK